MSNIGIIDTLEICMIMQKILTKPIHVLSDDGPIFL
jgi:hypothetical protein